jgi:dipeptidyl aminopeptidase/acylaminoacyl peptidase
LLERIDTDRGDGVALARRTAAAAIIVSACLVGLWANGARASFPGANGAIYFDAPDYADVASRIESVDIGGGDPSIIVGGALSPDVSPDGCQLAFVDEELRSELAIAPVAEPDRAKIVTRRYRDDTGPYDLGWSPDGRRLAFSYRDGIATIGLDDHAVHRLTRFRGDASPRWSVDGRIAFIRPTGNGNHALMRIRPDGSGLWPLTSGRDDAEPDWSPDGRLLAFVRQNDGSIYVIGADGRGLHRLTHRTDAVGVAWSPDGRLLVYGDRVRRGRTDLYTIGRDGKQRRHLARFRDQTGYLTRFAWQALPSPEATSPPAASRRNGDLAFAGCDPG